jgi:hypothetical protein
MVSVDIKTKTIQITGSSATGQRRKRHEYDMSQLEGAAFQTWDGTHDGTEISLLTEYVVL